MIPCLSNPAPARLGDTQNDPDVDPEEEKDIRAVRVIDRQYMRLRTREFFIDRVTGDERPS